MAALQLSVPYYDDDHDIALADACDSDTEKEIIDLVLTVNPAPMHLISIERMDVCGGSLFLFHLAEPVNTYRRSKSVYPMVWQGALSEVIETEEKPISTEELVAVEDDDMLGEAVNMYHSYIKNEGSYLCCDRIFDVQQISDPYRITRKHGFMEVSMHRVSLVADSSLGSLKRGKFIIQGLVRRYSWMLTLNRQMTRSTRTWRKKIRQLAASRDPSDHDFDESFNERKLGVLYPRKAPCMPTVAPLPEFLHDTDLISPQIVTKAWFAIENYNVATNANKELVQVKQASLDTCTGICKITLIAEESGCLETFTTEVREVDFIRLWMCSPPFLKKEAQQQDVDQGISGSRFSGESSQD